MPTEIKDAFASSISDATLQILGTILICGVIAICFYTIKYFLKRMVRRTRYKPPAIKTSRNNNIYDLSHNSQHTYALTDWYKRKDILSENERNAFIKIKSVTDELGLILFSKVRLLDLVEPIANQPKYKTALYKIQAKHVDFVICDKKINARIIIELDDSSHNRPDRQERDDFVDSVLNNMGYKVLRFYKIDTEQIKSIFATL